MIPIGDDNPTLRFPLVTLVLIALLIGVWVLVEGGGFDANALARAICEWGFVPGAFLRSVPADTSVPLGGGLACVLAPTAQDRLTPLTSMFLHGGWGHLIGNLVFFWVFGNNIEDVMGRFRFLVFYVVCGLAAAFAHMFLNPTSPVPTVGASGAISGVLGAYLLLFPRVRVRMLFILFIFIRVIALPAWLVLIWWFALQVLTGLPGLMSVRADVSGGVAVWAHVGGFVTGFLLARLFVNPEYLAQHRRVLARFGY